jgi:hypothetical protein
VEFAASVALPHWRNGIGLAAVSLLALAWIWFAVGLADTSLTPRLGAMYLDLTVLAVIRHVLGDRVRMCMEGPLSFGGTGGLYPDGRRLALLRLHLSRQLAKNPDNTQYKKAPTFAVSCESSEHTYQKGAPL